jgi:stress-induced morphogen
MKPQEMRERLQNTYDDGVVDVIDLTGTENHYEVYIESEKFRGMTRIAQHQHVMSVFAAELKTGEVHALSIRTKIKESADERT